MSKKIGDEYHHETKYAPGRFGDGILEWGGKPDLYKSYRKAQKIKLPGPSPNNALLHDILFTRKSTRSFSPQGITLGELSYLLWASNGIRERVRGFEFRTVPSAGALYPVETYFIVNRAEEPPRGVYHYSIKEHHIELIHKGDFGEEIADAALGQSMCAKAPVVFIFTALFARSKCKYQERAYRYIYMEAGHISQNLALAACSMNLGSCQIGAFFDDEVNRIIGVNGNEESAIYLNVVGHPA